MIRITAPRAFIAALRNGRFVFRGNEFALVCVGSARRQLTFETLNGDVCVLRAAR